MTRMAAFLLAPVLAAGLLACGGEERDQAAPAARSEAAPAGRAAAAPTTPADLSQALVLALAQFVEQKNAEGRSVPVPGPARMEFLVRQGGSWQMKALEDAESNVFHKVMVYRSPGQPDRLLSVAGTAAAVKLWSAGEQGLTAQTVWSRDFGGKFSRMRDVEVGDLYGDGASSLAVATHDQGVVAAIRPAPDGSFSVAELDHEKDTFVHEIEIGDLNGDGVLEVYSTPSEPNRMDGSVQAGKVTRYVPGAGEGRAVVADLQDRHAKEILVGDVDGDGTDELYVVVEGHVGKDKKLEHGVEVRRYESGTPPTQGVVIAEIQDRQARFLTAGDVEGDGQRELVLAAFSSGLWLLRPGADPMQPWRVESIDRDSGGFEHAALLSDLDGDGKDELYVASDKHKEVRRYAWDGTRLVREVIYRRPDDRAVFTWNIMPVPIELVP